ncbi:zinc-binding dehydrogenase [Alicyclobacillus tolerans]|uniref:zinc-dependent alcohol dehydrogenase n=1 Tax=Alicyclobacillus tolerans TaxID=90970 RepID=UPI001F3826F2|nr:zinc-binding dehydrogenase [Alicyclobacillus tolerans]MCF8563150.1 zinc-binding dehydrogenase [Alicyclobacillus tolerans]
MALSETVLAAVAVSSKKTELRELQVPEIPADAGLLQVEVVGVCGTDVANYAHIQEPRILGHHVIGFVDKIGREAARRWGVKEGDRVAMEEYIPCGQCGECRRGRYRACRFTDSHLGGLRYGNTPLHVPPALWGGFAQYMYLHPNAVLHSMPLHVLPVEAALTLPLANGFEWMAIECGVSFGQTVVVQGPGQQGLACVLAAKALGARVIVAGRETSRRRLELAKAIGADEVVNVSRENLIERVSQLTSGRLADVVIDVTSSGAGPVLQSIEAVKRGGVVALAAYKHQTIADFDIDRIVAKSLSVRGLRGHSHRSVEMAVNCIASGVFPMHVLNSHNYSLHQTDAALRTAGGEGESNPLLVAVSPFENRNGPSEFAKRESTNVYRKE